MAKKAKTPAPQAAETSPIKGARPGAEDWITKQTASVNAQLTEARELRATLLAEPTEAGLAQLLQLDDEIEGHEKMLRRLATAAAQRDAASTDEARKARHEQTKRELQEALNDARAVGAQAKEVLITLVELGARLQAMQERKDAIRARFSAALRASDLKEHVVESHHRVLGQALREVTLPASFLDRLWRSGAGRVGAVLEEHVLHVKPPSEFWQEGNLDEIIAAQVEKLKAIATAALATQQKEAA